MRSTSIFFTLRTPHSLCRCGFCWRAVPFAMTRKRPSDLENARRSHALKRSSSPEVVPHAAVGVVQRLREILD
jgi:hypothetical protein